MRRRGIWGLSALLAAAPAHVAGTEPATNVRLRNERDRHWARQVVEDAAESLAQPECARVLSELRDAQGQLLRAKLDATGVDVRTYVRSRIFFYDADDESACQRTGVLAYTTPGSRVVRLCPRFGELQGRRRADDIRAFLIHEMLHTLGLGENPPSSVEITQVVLRHCH